MTGLTFESRPALGSRARDRLESFRHRAWVVSNRRHSTREVGCTEGLRERQLANSRLPLSEVATIVGVRKDHVPALILSGSSTYLPA